LMNDAQRLTEYQRGLAESRRHKLRYRLDLPVFAALHHKFLKPRPSGRGERLEPLDLKLRIWYTVLVKRAFRFRFYPTEEQSVELNRTFGCVRVVWNQTLAERHKTYSTTGKGISYPETDKNLTALKRTPEYNFLSEVSSVPLQQTLRHQAVAFTNFFAKRARYPRFKSRFEKQSATYTGRGFTFRDGNVKLAKMKEPLDVRWSRDVPKDQMPSSVTVSRDATNRWHVSLLFDDDIEPFPWSGNDIGIDLGLKSFAVLSDGTVIDHPNLLRKKEKRLARYQRIMAKRVKGSNRRKKAKQKVARTHASIKDSRKDFLHKTSTDIVRQYDVIAVEDLAVKNMVRNHKLAKSISDSGWGEFRSQLEYKAEWYGKTFVVVDRFYPSSKTCSECGYLLKELSLGTRRWTCPSCRTLHDRDMNAAKNIIAEGHSALRRNSGEARGADVRHMGETPVLSAMKREPIRAGGSG